MTTAFSILPVLYLVFMAVLIGAVVYALILVVIFLRLRIAEPGAQPVPELPR